MERALAAAGMSVLVAALHVATRARKHLAAVVPVAGAPVLFFAGRDSAPHCGVAPAGDDLVWEAAAGLVAPLFTSLAVVAVLVAVETSWHRYTAQRALLAGAEVGVPGDVDAGDAAPVLVARLPEDRSTSEGAASAPDLYT